MTQDDQIRDCENRLFEAMKNSDIAVLDELLYEHLVFNMPSGQTISKAMDLESYRSNSLTIQEISATDQAITVIEDTATVVVTVHLKAEYAGQNIDEKLRYLRVWKQFGRAWKIIAGSGVVISQ